MTMIEANTIVKMINVNAGISASENTIKYEAFLKVVRN